MVQLHDTKNTNQFVWPLAVNTELRRGNSHTTKLFASMKMTEGNKNLVIARTG